MNSIADRLPPEIARQVHPNWRKNEAEYWLVRDQLLGQYDGQWVGFADGVVIASGVSPVEVLHAAQPSGKHPFLICVGREEEPCRIRRCVFPPRQLPKRRTSLPVGRYQLAFQISSVSSATQNRETIHPGLSLPVPGVPSDRTDHFRSYLRVPVRADHGAD